jgi:hypothetical protein
MLTSNSRVWKFINKLQMFCISQHCFILHCWQISVSIIAILIRRELSRYCRLMFMPWWNTDLYIKHFLTILIVNIVFQLYTCTSSIEFAVFAILYTHLPWLWPCRRRNM